MSDWRFRKVPYVAQSSRILDRLEVILRRNMGLKPEIKIQLQESFIAIDADEISRLAIVEDCEHEFSCELGMLTFHDETPLQALYDAVCTFAKAA